MPLSPTWLSLRYLREEQGCIAQVVERWNSFAKIRQDLFGFIDIVAICGAEVIGVQATSGSHHAERKRKIMECPEARSWARTGSVVVMSWTKKKNRWVPRIEDVTEELNELHR